MNRNVKKIIVILLVVSFLAGGFWAVNSHFSTRVEPTQQGGTSAFWDLPPDLRLMARTISAEARGEPYEGQVAVGAVILNRKRDPRFPNTISGVIYEPWAFTVVNYGELWTHTPDDTAVQATLDAVNGWDPSYGAVFFYNPVTSTSNWIFTRSTIRTIGKHIFAN
ncbi:cell wall hydrolase [Fuchsiella alkaliacetigena]|uniref:cell wall hydrolase n=1 Tax=Fuchsiella alkaliacetigena TaxID=957042 RepID=UPI00200A6277|nr:cell wall hydrolase [Fuchsiella alkaliacetigena]MCK8825765.1 cell wall hydrolase [Fuchsiella alkaliacetigena]